MTADLPACCVPVCPNPGPVICNDHFAMVAHSCRGKRRHDSQRASRQGKASHGVQGAWLVPYRCPMCRSWHNGSGENGYSGVRDVAAAFLAVLPEEERAALVESWHPDNAGRHEHHPVREAVPRPIWQRLELPAELLAMITPTQGETT